MKLNKEDSLKRGVSFTESGVPFFEESAEIDTEVKIVAEGKSTNTDELPKSIYPVLRAMTANKVTRNSTYYPKEELEGNKEFNTGIFSWIAPYETPVLKNHNIYDGEALGRVKGARVENGYLSLLTNITDSDGIAKVMDKRYSTVSINVGLEDIECSICGCKQFSEGWCDHYKGETYDIKQGNNKIEKRMCYYIARGIKGQEISFVNLPSDDQAQVIKTDIGEDGAKKWLSKVGTASSTSESVNKVKTSKASFQEAFSGFTLSEDFKKDKGLLNMSVDKVDSENKLQLPELTSVENIKKAAELLAESLDKKEDVDKETVKSVYNAIEASGISGKHTHRLVLSDTLGVAFGESESDVHQKDITLDEVQSLVSLDITKETLDILNAKLVSLETENSTLSENIKAYSNEAALKEKLDSVVEKLSKKEEEYKTMLVSIVSMEMIRKSYPLSKGRDFTELSEILLKRSEESLLDTYNDLISSIEEKEVPSTSKVENPLNVEQSKNLTSSLIEKLKNRLDSAVAEDTKDEELTVTVLGNGTIKVESTEKTSALDETSKTDENDSELDKYTLFA